MKKLFFLAVLSVSVLNLFSQEQVNLKETFLEAEYYILYEDYEEALALYKKLEVNNHLNSYINYRIGECYLFIPGQKNKAISYLEDACKNISEKIKEGSFKETNAPNKALFYLGSAYHINNELDKAIDTYLQFKELLDVQDIYNIDYVDQQIKACNNAKDLVKHPVHFKEYNIGNNLNDGFSNLRPVVSSDEQSIIYISELKFYDAILYSEKDSVEWSSPVNITPDLKSDGDYYSCFLSSNGETLLLFREVGFNGDIYISKNIDGKWQLPKKLNKNINTNYWETHACLSNDGKTMYFVSDRKEGYGGLDIYKSTFNEAINDWGPAINLGPEINTPFNEECPKITENGKVLYFSSQGHYTMGGYDIFYSNSLDSNMWSTPVNVGYPINSTDDDLFYYPIKNGEVAYISKFDKKGFGQEDIVKLEFYTAENPFLVNVRGTVSLKDNQTDFLKSEFDVNVYESASQEKLQQIFINETNGSFSAKLKPGSYNFVFDSKNYQKIEKVIFIPENYMRDELVFNVELTPKSVSTGEYLTIKNIYFGFDDYSLSKESKVELERLYNLMTKYPSLNIEIIGHTDSKGSKEYNRKLSLKRANSAINYLTEKGIDKNRFVAKGVGMEQPIAVNINSDGTDNAAGRKFNRRIEIKLLKSDEKIIINDDFDIPENLKVKELKYCILLSIENSKLSKDKLQNDKLQNYKINEFKSGDKYIYTLGECDNKSELIKIFNIVLESGFENAEIISSYDLNSLIK